MAAVAVAEEIEAAEAVDPVAADEAAVVEGLVVAAVDEVVVGSRALGRSLRRVRPPASGSIIRSWNSRTTTTSRGRSTPGRGTVLPATRTTLCRSERT